MAIKSSGPLALSEITAEFGGPAPNVLSNYYRGGSYVPTGAPYNAQIPTAGAISFSQFYNAAKRFEITISANTIYYNALNDFNAKFGSHTTSVSVHIVINAGVTVGSNSTSTPAFDVGQFPSGSDILIDNYGSIQGAGGPGGGYYSAGGKGGDAIKANYPNQNVTINNQSGGAIYSGGGGGGSGGVGGTGGTGGQGYYNYWGAEQYAGGGSAYAWQESNTGYLISYGAYGNVYSQSGGYGYPGYSFGTQYGNYLRGPLRESSTGYDAKGNVTGTDYYYGISQLQTAYTSGGAGGGGGAGGAGGRGYGYDGANVGGYSGQGGYSGAGGGANAGAGGSGGTGGAGGAGGGWGAYGNGGATGATGNFGASGNYTGGSAGAAGSGGAGGGAPGSYLIKGSAAVTLNNSGSLAGLLT